CATPPPRLLPFSAHATPPQLHSFPTRRSSDLTELARSAMTTTIAAKTAKPKRREKPLIPKTRSGTYWPYLIPGLAAVLVIIVVRSEEHTSELQSRFDLVCRLLLEKKNKTRNTA